MAGVVLCGGRSTRMGRDKALLEVEGRPLVVRVAGALEEAATPVFLAPGTVGRLGHLGHPEIGDAADGAAGPIGGIVAALRASPHDLTAVVAVDMPFASAELFRLLAKLVVGFDAAVPVTTDGLQPLHAVYAHTALPALERAMVDGSMSVQGALGDLRPRLVHPDEWRAVDPSGRFAVNLNRAEDLALLE